MADETPENLTPGLDRFTPTTGLPIEQAPDYTDLPTEGVDDPAYAAAVRGEEPEAEDPAFAANRRYEEALKRGLSEAEAQEEGWPTSDWRDLPGGTYVGPEHPEEPFPMGIDWALGEKEEGQPMAGVPRWPFGIGALNPDTGKLEGERPLSPEEWAHVEKSHAELERLVAEAREKMARTPDGVEGDLSAPAGETLQEAYERLASEIPAIGDSDFVPASRVGAGISTGIDDETGETYRGIAVVLELDAPEESILPPLRLVRQMDAATATKLARNLLDMVLNLVSGEDQVKTPAEEPAAGEPDAAEKLDTEE